MEAQLRFKVSKFYHGIWRQFTFFLVLYLISISTNIVLGQIKDPNKKYIICHHLPDNPDKTITIEVGLDELQEHLDHGDTFGPCFDGDLNGDILPYFEPPEIKVEEEIGAALTSLVKQFEKLGSVPSDDIYIINGDKALIEIIAENIDAVSTIESYISTHYPDAIIYSDYGDPNDDLIITVLFPIKSLNDLNEDLYQAYNIISFARPVYTPILKSGMVNSQGDIAIQSDNARKAFESVDGSGAKVCVISDSYNAKQKAQADMDNEDLPFEIDVSEDFPSDYGAHFYVVDEGRAMLQIIHDIAPGALLGFKTGFKGIEHMADGIQLLSTVHGCNVMVDDVTHLAEPFFVDGLISKAVEKVSGEGVIYISSAGNFADWGHADQFYPAVGNETFHSFSHDGSIYQKVRFENPGVYIIVLQWDDVYKSLGGINNSGAQNDLDISLVDKSGNTLVALNCKNTGGDPVEVMPIKVENAGALANLVIQKASGDENVNFKYIVFVGGQDFIVESQPSSVSTIVGQANASSAYTVGAAFYDQSPALGVELPTIEPFSSHGGSLINGTDRNKPDFVGPDGVNTSVFSVGADTEKDDDPFPNFLGTSAAAPHAAGIAALVWHAASVFDVPGIDPGVTMKQTALDMYESGYDKKSGSGFLLADEAIMSFASPKPTITELIVPDNKTPGEKALTATIIGENLTVNSQVLLNGIPLDARDVTYIDRTTINAKIPIFTGDALVQVYNPFITPSELDGGYSDELSFFSVPKKKIVVKADAKTKKFGEKHPEFFTASLFFEDIPLSESTLEQAEKEFLLSIEFFYKTTAKLWSDTENQYCSPTGIYIIAPYDINLNSVDPNDLEELQDYEFEYKEGLFTIEKLPITIKPITKDSYVYGESFQGIGFEYDLYSDGAENNNDIDNLELLLEYIQEEHQSTFREEITNAIVDRAKQLVNRGKQLVNESGWLVSDAALSNRAKQLVNGDFMIDLDINLLTNYVDPVTYELINPDGTIPNRGKQLVNGEFFFNGDAYIKDELGNRAKQLVNEGAIGTNESDGEDFTNISLIVDTTDATVSNIYSINLISGIDVNDGDYLYDDAPQYCVPGAFISPAADNFNISYTSTEFNILPADLTVTADNKQMFLEDLVMPKFTSTFDGFQYDDNENNIFSNISYTTTEFTDIGEYDILPVNFEFFDEINYNIIPASGVLTVQHISNGQIAAATENSEGLYDLTLFNTDGSNPVILVSASGLVPGSVRDPEFSPNGEEIVFTSTDSDTFSDLWKVNSDGSGLIQLTTDGLSGLADFSPDGTQIAFIWDGNIAIMNTDGSYPKTIHETPEREWWPFYAPDGEELYFTRYTGEGINDIFKIDLGPARSNLLHWWPADGNVYDIERGNYGSLQGGATFGPGQLSQAFQFDGIDDFVMVPDNPSLNFGTRDFTVELWVNFTSTDGEQVLIEKWVQKHERPSSGWTLTKLEDNTLRLALSEDNESEVGLDVTPPSLTEDKWYHVAITREGNIFTLYWNGSAFLDNIDCSYNLSSASSLKMGHRGNIYDTPGSQDERGFYLHGFIDEVKIFNRALSAAEILEINTSSESQITADNIFYRQPDFLRDGTKILATRAENSSLDSYDIVTLDPDGSDLLSIYTGAIRSATASPDKQKIAFTRESDQLKLLEVINPDGSGEQIIVEQSDLQIIQPNWGTSPDGVNYINIPDPKFEEVLVALEIDTDGVNGQIYKSDALAVTILDISDPVNRFELPKITDLTGIEGFKNLTRLYCQSNQLTNLDLSQNTAMVQLYCFDNQIEELDFSQNLALNDLLCYENQLTSLNVSQNAALIHLNCYGNQLASLDVSNNTSLTGLSCYDNDIAILDLSQNIDLEALDCAGNELTVLDVSANTKLTYLSCPFNMLADLDVSTNTALVDLLCAGNELTELDVSKNIALTQLKCEGNNLTTLDVTKNTALNFLDCNNNQLKELDLTHNTALLQIQCGANQLTELDVSQNTLLDNITCYENQLTSLDVTQNLLLDALSCDVNQITSLDVSQNSVLTYLYCSANKLTSLDVRNGNNDNITTFVAHDNDLNCISVDDETADHSDWQIDFGVSFSNDCDIPVPITIIDQNFEQALIDLNVDRDGVVNQQISKYDALVIPELDISDPVNNPNLPNVNAKITDLTGIEAFSNLYRLFCDQNEIRSLDMSQSPLLIELQCGSNLLTELNVKQNSVLEVLDCQVNQLTELDVSLNTKLNSLSFQVNQISSIEISSLTSLVQFNCEANRITNLNLEHNVLLKDFGCGANPLTGLDISNNTALESLRCYANGLTSLDVAPHTALTELLCGSNQLTELNLLNNTNLMILDCGHNQLDNIDLSNNTSLVNLHCGANPLLELDLSLNTSLTDLTCYENQLTSLDVSHNVALQALSCDINQITNLDISQNPALTYLYCAANQLTSLDVRNGNNENITTFVAHDNNLTCISVDLGIIDRSHWVVDPGVIFTDDCSNITANLWVLSNTDPENNGPPYGDYLIAYDSDENLVLQKSGFNTQFTITGNEYIKVSEQGDYAWIVENVDHNLSKISSTGDVLAIPNPSIMYGRMSMTSDERLYVLEYTGEVTGGDVYILDKNGTIIQSEPYGGGAIVLDENHSAIWIAGNDLRKYDMNLQSVALNSNPISGEVFSMDFDHEGNLWIGEHVDGGNDRLLYVSPLGELLDFKVLSNDIVSVKVNRLDGKIWYITGNNLSYFDPETSTTVIVGDHYWSFDIDYSTEAIWAFQENELYRYSFNGVPETIISNSLIASFNAIGTRSYFGATMALTGMMSDPLTVSIIEDGNVKIYPNPVVDRITIEFTDQSVVLGDVTITIYNDQPSVETVTITENLETHGFDVDFNSLMPGTYYLQLYDGIETRVFRLIKE